MAKQTLSVRKTAQGTVIVRAGRYTETVTIVPKTKKELFEAVRWAILTSGFTFSEEVEKMVRDELDLW